MADIYIKRKRKPVWPWILGLILLVVAVFAIIQLTGKNKNNKVAYQENYVQEEAVRPGMPGIDQEEDEGRGVGMASADTSSSKAEELSSFVSDRQFEQIGKDPQVTSQGLMKLSAAIQELAPDFQTTANRLNEAAKEINQNPDSKENSKVIQNAIQNTSEALRQFQEEQYPDRHKEVMEVEDAANGLNPEGNLENQSEQLKEFFEKASNAINEMQMEGQPS